MVVVWFCFLVLGVFLFCFVLVGWLVGFRFFVCLFVFPFWRDAFRLVCKGPFSFSLLQLSFLQNNSV